MVDLIKEVESVPASYPDVEARWVIEQAPDDEDPGSDQVWQRIEAWTRTRYTPREVLWTIEGLEGAAWEPPLSPVVSMSAERWDLDAWVAVTLQAGPVGQILPSDGYYRITATVGAGDPPAAVAEAFKRLHEYGRGISESFKGEAAFSSEDGRIPPNWAARAIQLSGAADLLRPYRRQK